MKLALRYRSVLTGDRIFFGIAGSAGKTTAKDLLLGMLSSQAAAVGNRASLNRTSSIASTILRIRPWHRYCVAELGETGPDSLDELLAIARPSIGIVTVIGDDHLTAFGSRAAVGREFAKLAQALPSHGTLVLNRDDEAVFGLRHLTAGRVISYGTTLEADLHASDVIATWPEPLRFTASFHGQSIAIRTRLYGRHLLTSALAALGGALAAGVPLNECAKAVSRVAPFEGRMQAVRAIGDIAFLRDDFKSPAWTVGPLLDFLREAHARRKIFILGSISDCRHKQIELPKLAHAALAVADIVIVTGPLASAALRGYRATQEKRLFAFTHTRDVLTFIESIRQGGDLIVVKGTNKKDHLSRIVLAMTGQNVNCWVDNCGRDLSCSACSHLNAHCGPPGLLTADPNEESGDETACPPLPSAEADDQFIIGLGNPGSAFAGTPHNVGHEAVDVLCASLDSRWVEYADAWLAETLLANRRLWLVRLKTPMNLSGPALKKLASTMGFTADRCILVFDDITRPLGKVRTRMDGSSGGHRGVASILEAFQSDEFRRIKVGVGSAQTAPTALLERFDDADYAAIRQSFQTVAAHAQRLLATRR
jgi:aminoacyl-tRNA hydrolase